jgi:hypothetical protein
VCAATGAQNLVGAISKLWDIYPEGLRNVTNRE